MDYEKHFVLYRSRKTLLKILADRGYTTAPFEKFGPLEISAMISAGAEALRMDLERAAPPAEPETEQPAQEANQTPESSPITKCRVLYALNKIKNHINGFVEDLTDPEEMGEDAVDPATTEVIVILVDEVIGDPFHAAALAAYMNKRKRLRISFFQANQLVHNPLEHSLVPKHERVPATEHEALLKKLKVKTKANFPLIKFHEDMIARIIGLMPGEIVRITAASPSAGEYIKYRVCVP